MERDANGCALLLGDSGNGKKYISQKDDFIPIAAQDQLVYPLPAAISDVN